MAYAPIYESSGPTVLAIAEEVKRKYPGDWTNAHNHQASGAVYIRRVAWAVHVASPQLSVGLNGKRGNVHDLSQDVLCFPNASGAGDATGRWGGLEIRDIIASAGTPAARLVWGDVTQATVDQGTKGAWIAPEPVDEPTAEPPPPLKSREQFYAEFQQVNDFYIAQDGLQRTNPRGMALVGADGIAYSDSQAMGAWAYDLMAGATVDECKAAIAQTHEWKTKHQGETP